MIVIDCEQGDPLWFQSRLGLATASCFSDILSKGKGSDESASRRNYRLKLVLERLTGKIAQGFTSAAMTQGTEREPLARAVYESRFGRFVDLVGFLRHDELDAGASPDGLIDADGLQEIKCPEPAAHLEVLRSNEAPSKYYAQIQGQLWIAEREWCDFCSYQPEFPEALQLKVIRVERDERYIAGLALAVSIFMDEVRKEERAVRELEIAA